MGSGQGLGLEFEGGMTGGRGLSFSMWATRTLAAVPRDSGVALESMVTAVAEAVVVPGAWCSRRTV